MCLTPVRIMLNNKKTKKKTDLLCYLNIPYSGLIPKLKKGQ